ncbi:hypothetical protein ACQUQU_11770 [Thalassolituus sp. LLYu03]|uniref:hypothetical protein n=1 Tax=Thalassolituus sp. LLYu03 TaxID=3421656 RepID=UPI003D2D4E08
MRLTVFLCLVLSALTGALPAHALTQLSDDELSQETGQGFIQIDRPSSDDFDFTRFTFGIDADVSLNADLIDLGNYERDGSSGSDILINDFALGSVNDDGTLNPFSISDPFFELAFETDADGNENIVGVRLGFGEALGYLSGNIESLTGNIEVNVTGTADAIYDEASWIQQAALTLAGVDRDTVLSSSAVLVDADGNEINVRATSVGIPNGTALTCEDGCNLGGLSSSLLSLFKSDGCEILGLTTCFSLSTFRTLEIGDLDTATAATGMFISFQSKDVTWIDSGTETTAVSGAFMNIPNGGITVDFEQSFNGIERIRTKFLDPYYD